MYATDAFHYGTDAFHCYHPTNMLTKDIALFLDRISNSHDYPLITNMLFLSILSLGCTTKQETTSPSTPIESTPEISPSKLEVNGAKHTLNDKVDMDNDHLNTRGIQQNWTYH